MQLYRKYKIPIIDEPNQEIRIENNMKINTLHAVSEQLRLHLWTRNWIDYRRWISVEKRW